jgi:hypothetical protein
MEVGHKHVSRSELDRLFADRFVIEERRFTGPVTVVLLWLQILALLLHMPDRLVWAINSLRGWESGIDCPAWMAFSVRLVARRL